MLVNYFNNAPQKEDSLIILPYTTQHSGRFTIQEEKYLEWLQKRKWLWESFQISNWKRDSQDGLNLCTWWLLMLSTQMFVFASILVVLT